MNRRRLFSIIPAGILSILYSSPMKAILSKDDRDWIVDRNGNVIHKSTAHSYDGCIPVMAALRESYGEKPGEYYHYPPNAYSVQDSQNYSKEFWDPKLTKCQSEIDSVRKWAEDLQEYQVRNCYLYWIDVDQRKIDTAKHELQYQTEKLYLQKFQKDEEIRRARLEEFKRKVTIPVPPRVNSKVT